MVLGDTELEREFAKIYRKGAKKTLEFFRKVLSKCPTEIRAEFETMIHNENVKNIETTDAYKKVQSEYERIYVPNSVGTLKFIAKNMESLPEHALGHIFNIIRRHDESYTAKKMEALVNLGTLKEKTIQEIIKFILFIKSSTIQLNSVSETLSSIKNNFSNIDAVEEVAIPTDPNYMPILYDYAKGPAPVMNKNHV